MLIQIFILVVLNTEHCFYGIFYHIGSRGQAIKASTVPGADGFQQHHSDQLELPGNSLILLRVGLLGINRAYSIDVQQMVAAKMIFW